MHDTDSAASRLPALSTEPAPGLSGDLERELATLGRSLAGMHARHPFDADFWSTFKACAGDIGRRAANDTELRRVQMRLVLLLSQETDLSEPADPA